jgi:hypothetical protein
VQSFTGPSTVGLVTIFYYLRFDTSLFITSCDSQGYGGGIGTRLHTGDRGKWIHTRQYKNCWTCCFLCGPCLNERNVDYWFFPEFLVKCVNTIQMLCISTCREFCRYITYCVPLVCLSHNRRIRAYYFPFWEMKLPLVSQNITLHVSWIIHTVAPFGEVNSVG